MLTGSIGTECPLCPRLSTAPRPRPITPPEWLTEVAGLPHPIAGCPLRPRAPWVATHRYAAVTLRYTLARPIRLTIALVDRPKCHPTRVVSATLWRGSDERAANDFVGTRHLYRASAGMVPCSISRSMACSGIRTARPILTCSIFRVQIQNRRVLGVSLRRSEASVTLNRRIAHGRNLQH